jgi:hypothetical protein
MADLDQLIARARASSLKADVIDAGVAASRAAALRAAERTTPRTGPRWLLRILAGIAVATLGVAWAAGIVTRAEPEVAPAAPEPTEHGAPVAIAPEPPVVIVRRPTTLPLPVAPGAPEQALPAARAQPVRHPALVAQAPDAVAPVDLAERWRGERRRRAAGDLAGALADCLAIADTADPVWTPISLLEAARIELGPLADVDAARRLAQRLLDDWPASALAPEARELRCRALVQLGRPCP